MNTLGRILFLISLLGISSLNAQLPVLSKTITHVDTELSLWSSTAVYNAPEPGDFDAWWQNKISLLPAPNAAWDGGPIDIGSAKQANNGTGVINWNGASTSSKKPILIVLPSAGAAPGLGLCPDDGANYIVASAMSSAYSTATVNMHIDSALAILQMIRNIKASGKSTGIVYVEGKSQGGGMTLLVAGLCEDVRDIFVSVPAMTGYTVTGPPNGAWPSSSYYVDNNPLGPYVDAVNHAKRYRNRATFSLAYGDTITWGRGHVTAAKNVQYDVRLYHNNPGTGHNDDPWWGYGDSWVKNLKNITPVNNGVGLAGSGAPANIPKITVTAGPTTSITTNQAFNITLTADKANGKWFTNSSQVPVSFFPSTTINITHSCTLRYFGSVSTTNGKTNSLVFTFDTTAPTVSLSQVSGTYGAPFTLTLTTTENNGEYSTTSSTGPWTSFAAPSTTMLVNSTRTVWFRGKDRFGNTSAVDSRTYTMTLPPYVTPSVVGGTYASPQAISLAVTANHGYWSTNSRNGPYTQFGTAGTVVPVNKSKTLWYYGDNGSMKSATNSEVYTINVPVNLAPLPSNLGASYQSLGVNRLTWNADGMWKLKIYCATNGPITDENRNSAIVLATNLAPSTLSFDHMLSSYPQTAKVNPTPFWYAVTCSTGVTGGAGGSFALITNTSGGEFQNVKIHYETMWVTPAAVTQGGNRTIEFYIKEIQGAVAWNNIAIKPKGDSGKPIGNYVTSAPGWTKVTIPISDFPAATWDAFVYIEFQVIGLQTLPHKFGIDEVRFIGGSTPFQFFTDAHDNNGLESATVFGIKKSATGGASLVTGMEKSLALGVNSSVNSVLNSLTGMADNIPVVTVTSGPTGNVTTNQAFSITLTADKASGMWFTNISQTPISFFPSTTINITHPCTLRYYGRAGTTNGTTNSRIYTFDLTAPSVTASHTSGTYSNPFDLHLSVNENNGEYSTLSSTGPWTSFTTSGVDIPINVSQTVWYRGIDRFGNTSSVQSRSFTMVVPPVVTPNVTSGSFTNAFLLSLSTTADYGFWSTNAKTGPYTQFSGIAVLPINKTKTVWYYGDDLAGRVSATNNQTYTVTYPVNTDPKPSGLSAGFQSQGVNRLTWNADGVWKLKVYCSTNGPITEANKGSAFLLGTNIAPGTTSFDHTLSSFPQTAVTYDANFYYAVTCYTGGSGGGGGGSYIQFSNTGNNWQPVKVHVGSVMWASTLDFTGKTGLEFKIKTFQGTFDWSKIEIKLGGNSDIGDWIALNPYVSTAVDWTTITIPISAFTGIPLNGIKYIGFTDKGLAGPYKFGVDDIKAVGGTEIVVFDDTKDDNALESSTVFKMRKIATGGAGGSGSTPIEKSVAVGINSTTSAAVNNTVSIIDTDPPSVPVLVAPLDSSFSTGNPNLVWSRSTDVGKGILNYTVFLSSNNFISTQRRYTVGSANTTNYLVAPALGNASWKWTVKARDKATNLSAAAVPRSVVVDALAPTIPSLTAPANGSTNNNSINLFSWAASSDNGPSGLQGYEFTLGAFTTNVSGTSLSRTLADGVSSWSVRSFDAAGNYSSSASRSLTVDTAPPTVVSLDSPTDGEMKTSTSVTFTWNATSDGLTGVKGYQLTYSNSSSGLNRVSVAGTSHAVSLPDASVTVWKVRAYDRAGNTNNASSSRIVSVDTTQIIPTLHSPADATLVANASPIFSWSSHIGASKYAVEILSNSVVVRFTTNIGTAQTNASFPALGNAVYTWRVKAFKTITTWQSWQTASAFTVDTIAPSVPAPTAPSTLEFTNVNSVQLVWNASSDANGIQGYEVILNGTPFPVGGTSYAAGSLSLGTNTWAVRAQDNAGNWGSASAVRKIVVDTVNPTAPTLVLPTDAVTLTNIWPLLVWNRVNDLTGVSKYVVTLDGTPLDANTATNYQPIIALAAGAHTWSVHAVDGAGNIGSVAGPRTFTIFVDQTGPSIPATVAPQSGSTVYERRPFFVWTKATDSSGIASYRVVIGNQTNLVSGSQTNFQPGYDLPYGLNSWKVFAVDSLGNKGLATTAVAFTVAATPGFSDSLQENTFRVIPNPYKPNLDGNMKFYFNLSSTNAKIEFTLLTITGETVRTLLPAEGSDVVEWDGKNNEGKDVARGIYFCLMRADKKVMMKPVKFGLIR